MTSEAGVISKPSSRGMPSCVPPMPITVRRSARSFMSRQRRQVIRRASRPWGLPWNIELSSAAASRLLAVVTACRSPVKCRLMSSAGSICERSPPVPPPLMPMTGPTDGSRKATVACAPRRRSAWVRPIEVVVLPSPAVVGVIPVTSTRRPTGASRSRARAALLSLAL